MPRAQREQLILSVAGALFARDGYHGASMDEIAAAAGVSKPMLYAYFDSKEGLYVAYIELAGQELIERLDRAFAQEPLRLRVDAFLAFVEEHRDGWRVLWGEASASAPVAEETAQLRGRITAAVQRLLLGGPPEGVFDDDAAAAAAHAIVGAGEALANWWLERPEVPRAQVAAWYAAVVRATVVAIGRAEVAGPPVSGTPGDPG